MPPVHFYDSPAFCLQWPTVVDQTTIPPTPVTRLIAKRNAHLQITFRTTEGAKYDQTKEEENEETMSVVKAQVTIRLTSLKELSWQY